MSDEKVFRMPDLTTEEIEASMEALNHILAEAAEIEVNEKGVFKVLSGAAGYMELDGAEKDGECKIVLVEGGISKDLGCCNLYVPKDGAQKFNCGHCKYET